MAGCKTDFLCTLRDVFSYIIWIKGPLLACNLNICQILDITSPLAIFVEIANFAKIASLQGATFGIQLKPSEAGDFSPFLPFSPLYPFLDMNGDVHGTFWHYAVLRSHWKCVVFHCFSWNGSGLICRVLELQWNYCVFTIDTILSWNIGPRRTLVLRSHFRRTGK